jgi:hypothetical protein
MMRLDEKIGFFRLTSALIREDAESVEMITKSGDFASGRLRDFLVRHRLAEYCLFFLKQAGMEALFHEDFIQWLGKHVNRQAARTDWLLKGLNEVADTLQTGGTPFMVLKGPYYSFRFAGGPDSRFMHDIDIMVRQQDVEHVILLLLRIGFKIKSSKFISGKLTRLYLHALEFERGDLELDLHWCFRNRPGYRIDYNKLWNTRQEFSIEERNFPVLSDEYNLVLLIVSMANDLECSRFKAKNLVDLYVILKAIHAGFDWEGFLMNRKSEGLLKMSINIFGIFMDVLGCRSEFPDMREMLNANFALVEMRDEMESIRLAAGGRQRLWNRIWFSRIYPGTVYRYWSWWALTLPFRFASGKKI